MNRQWKLFDLHHVSLKRVQFQGAVVRRLRCPQFRVGTFHASVGLSTVLLASPMPGSPSGVLRLHNGAGQLVRTGLGATTS